MMKHITNGAEGMGLDSQVSQTGLIVANDFPLLRHFFGAVLSRH